VTLPSGEGEKSGFGEDAWGDLLKRTGVPPDGEAPERSDFSSAADSDEPRRTVRRPWLRIIACVTLALASSSLIAALISSKGSSPRPNRRTIEERPALAPTHRPRAREKGRRRHIGARERRESKGTREPRSRVVRPQKSVKPAADDEVPSTGQGEIRPAEGPPAALEPELAPTRAAPSAPTGPVDGATHSSEFGL
jgi:hypothetical protein